MYVNIILEKVKGVVTMVRVKIKRYDYGAPVHTELYEFKTGVFFVVKDDELQGCQMLIDEAELKELIDFGANIAKLMDHKLKVEGNLHNYQFISCEFVGENDKLVKYSDINGVLIYLDSNDYLNVNYYLKDGKLMDDVINSLDKVCKVLYSLIVKHLSNKLSI